MKFFEQNCIVKWAIFFPSFCWLWDFLLENLKLKRNSENVRWYIWADIKKLYAQNNILKKIIPNMTFWIIYILVQIFFLGTALGCFSQFFLIFCRWPTMVTNIFTQPAPPQKASYGPGWNMLTKFKQCIIGQIISHANWANMIF